MPSSASKRFEVWGSPIGHSKSPQLHRAAYDALGLDWDYRAVEVATEQLADSFHTLPSTVGGLSLTMPLKEGILSLVSDRRGPVDLLHAANTVVRSDDEWWLDNTDWWGAARVLSDHGGVSGDTIWMLGAGATARAVVYALSTLGPAKLVLVVRSPERARVTEVLAQTLALPVEVAVMSDVPAEPPQWVISTLPGGVVAEIPGLDAVAGSSTLFDIAYDPWPSALGAVWEAEGSGVISGLEMLVYQALAQIRAFVHADTSVPLEAEARVLDAMWTSVGLERPSHPGV
jgi:shikimate dehydrogenase